MAEFSHKNKYVWKYTDESFDIQYSFVNDLGSGDSISTATVTCTDSEGTSTTSAMISGRSVSSPNVIFTLSAGSADTTYEIKITATTSGGKDLTHYITLEVYNTITLNSKLGDPNANSYVTLVEANKYIRNKRNHSDTWDSLSIEGKKRVLIQACYDINRFNFIEGPYYDNQALPFPNTDHDTETGNVATPLSNITIKNSNLSDSTYGGEKSYNDYWQYGTFHVVNATPLNDIRNVATSNFQNDVIHLKNSLSATPTTNTTFRLFTPLDSKVKKAQMEQALFILSVGDSSTIESYKNNGAEEVRIGDVSVRFKKGASLSKSNVSPIAYKLMSYFISRNIKIGRA